MNIPIQLIGHFTFMFLMIVLLAIGITKAYKKGANWLQNHRKFVLSGVVSGLIGFAIMAIAKQVNDYPHFVSSHSKGGLTTLILALITPIFGYLLMKQIIKVKTVHKTLGLLTLIMSIIAASFGIFMVATR